MVDNGFELVKNREYYKANALYKRIKDFYVKMQPTNIKQREEIRNKILRLYKGILMLGPHGGIAAPKLQFSPMGQKHVSEKEIEKRIQELKSRSKAQVRMPA